MHFARAKVAAISNLIIIVCALANASPLKQMTEAFISEFFFEYNSSSLEPIPEHTKIRLVPVSDLELEVGESLLRSRNDDTNDGEDAPGGLREGGYPDDIDYHCYNSGEKLNNLEEAARFVERCCDNYIRMRIPPRTVAYAAVPRNDNSHVYCTMQTYLEPYLVKTREHCRFIFMEPAQCKGKGGALMGGTAFYKRVPGGLKGRFDPQSGRFTGPK